MTTKTFSIQALLVMSALGFGTHAAADVLGLEPIQNTSFETTDVADGATNEDMSSWTSSSQGSRIADPAAAVFSTIPDGTQVGLLFNGSVANQVGWFYQTLRGTSDTNGAVHDLTADEAAGQTFAVTFWVGRGMTDDTYNNQNVVFTVGLEGATGVEDSAVYDKTAGSSTTGSIELDLDSGEWKQVTTILTVDPTTVNGANTLRLAYRIDGASTQLASAVYFDDLSITLVPEPGSFALLGLGALAIIRRRH